MLFDAGRDRQDIRIENDVVRVEANLIDKDAIRPFTDPDLLVVGRRLAVLIEGHHHHGSTVFHDVLRRFLENFLTLLERDRVHDPLSLKVLETFLEDLPLRGVHHDWHFRYVRLTLEKIQIAAHHRLAIDQAVIKTDIDHVRTVGHLLACHLDRRLKIICAN